MIPVKLTLQGLYSYKEKQTIDFTRLTKAGLFGIFGTVGSGKSSIIEAISFALYQECERLNLRDNRNYNMMNLKSKELIIDFEFIANDSNEYRVEVKGKRNNKKFEDVKTFIWSTYKKENDDWSPIANKSIESITGLNYKNFRRTTIIPQGHFQEFLQLNPVDRAAMLKELFNLFRFDLSNKVTSLESKNNAALQNLSGQMQGIGEVNPERITEIEKLLQSLKSELKILKEEQETKQKLDQEQEQLKKQTQTILTQKSKLLALQESENEINELDVKIKEYERFFLVFRSDIDRLNELEKNVLTRKTNIKKQMEQALGLQNHEKLLKTAYLSLKPEFDKKEQLLRESEELNKLAEIKESEEVINKLKKRFEEYKKSLQTAINSITFLREQNRIKSDEINTLKKTLPDFKTLTMIKDWFIQKKNFEKNNEDVQKRLIDSAKTLNNLKDKMAKNVDSSKIFKEKYSGEDISTIVKKSEKEKTLCEEMSENISIELVHLQVQNKLGAYATELEDGKPCPLCGSKSHPDILNQKDVKGQITKLESQKNEIANKIKVIINLEKMLTGLEGEMAGIKRQILADEKNSQQINDQMNSHLKSFTWNDYCPNNFELVQEAIGQHEVIINSIEQAEEKIKENTRTLENKEKEKDKISITLQETEQQLIRHTSIKDLLYSQIKNIEIKDYANFTLKKLKDAATSLLNKHDDIIKQFKKTDEELININSSISKLAGKIEEAEISLKNLESEKSDLVESINKKLILAGNLQQSYVVSILQEKINVLESRKKIEKYRQDVESIKKFLLQIEKELDGREYNNVKHDEIKLRITLLKSNIEEKNRKFGEFDNEIKRLKSDAERFVKLKAEIDNLKLREQDITELKNLFRGSGFVNYVSTVYLENLCRSANERFYKLTRKRLGLELADGNTFQVRDYMNEGKLRSVKTLSGGQIFQASLSLALSLADSIHKVSGSSENFFFLDEGFGTLDKESLDTVFETLKSLRRENRIVGVISHVEDMQQEIETYLKVVNDEERGSLVNRSWCL